MTLYAHRIDPHYSHDHADLYFEGWRYLLSDTDVYPIVPQYPISERDYERNKDKLATP